MTNNADTVQLATEDANRSASAQGSAGPGLILRFLTVNGNKDFGMQFIRVLAFRLCDMHGFLHQGSCQLARSVGMTERSVLLILVHKVLGSNPIRGRIQLMIA